MFSARLRGTPLLIPKLRLQHVKVKDFVVNFTHLLVVLRYLLLKETNLYMKAGRCPSRIRIQNSDNPVYLESPNSVIDLFDSQAHSPFAPFARLGLRSLPTVIYFSGPYQCFNKLFHSVIVRYAYFLISLFKITLILTLQKIFLKN